MVRTRAKDHDDKRQHILSVAAEVYAREGIARASMNEVARACGISKANIYHYYASKDDLVFDILDTYLSQLRELVTSVDCTQKSPSEKLHAITRAFLLAYEGMDNEHKIQSEGLPLLTADKQNVLKGYQRDLVEVVSQSLRECAPEALAQSPSKCREMTMSVFGMMNWFYMWSPGATREKRVEYAKTIADLTLYGLTKP
ncbi:TetR/AcrR family transcriptional regulator [uncultured Litoreibacter sp.]|uniref:TetR/AcrR family transcriptional regulator n=1 Tax=uncultured Litoreibacter sp. TaxID=1392394 RepID=UPI0026135098|nr:TetR/AcrR family transcriptional regulator [uncultured Litoreibacter sp.]